MSVRQNFLKAALGLGMALSLASCDKSPPQIDTDPTVDNVLKSPSPEKAKGKYFIIEEGGAQKGVVFISKVYPQSSSLCADYEAWAQVADSYSESKDSGPRTRCLSKSSLGQPTAK